MIFIYLRVFAEGPFDRQIAPGSLNSLDCIQIIYLKVFIPYLLEGVVHSKCQSRTCVFTTFCSPVWKDLKRILTCVPGRRVSTQIQTVSS